MASVRVAVRVRPFNQREIDLESKLIISMDEKKTKISNMKIGGVRDAGAKEFTFDHSYWSFDCEDAHFATQEQVFQDLGTEVVDSAFEGYNACVFAYGQTGSGKTFTMMGSAENQGLIPRICKSLFERMHLGREGGASYRTEVSYLEIYNEKVKDLLQNNSDHSLRVREHPTMGPYVQSLSKHLVSDYPDIQEWMKRGNVHRTTARTNMNDTSSRSHAIFTITFVQAEFSHNNPTETVSKIHLVDLAGSERADATGATGERLKEGAHINKSLVTLGLVISSLAKLSSNPNDPAAKRNSTFIPYRDSVLTWLLKDSLGGNSKTIMIAAISPADVNYEETLSTLRYANRAKNIINKPTVNEDPNVTLIRTLRDEINKLKSMLNGHVPDQLPEQSVLDQLQQKEAREKALTEEWTEKWRETKQILEEQSALGLRKSGVGIILDSNRPHLVGIDDDLLSTGVTLYHLKDGETLIGTEESEQKQDIELSGVGIIPQHCSLVLHDGQAWLHPNPNAHCWVNSQPIDKPTRLSQGCILLLGRNNMFRFNNPAEAAALRKSGSRSHLNLSNISSLCVSSTDMPERTFSIQNLLDSNVTDLYHSSPNEQRAMSVGDIDKQGRVASKPQELVDLEADYKIEKERLVADWKRLEEKHNQDVAEWTDRQSVLGEKKEHIEKCILEETLRLDKLTKEVIELERRKCERQDDFENLICKCMEELRMHDKQVAADMASQLATATSPSHLLAVLKGTVELLPQDTDYQKDVFLHHIDQYTKDMKETEKELATRENMVADVHSLVSSLNSQLSTLTSSSDGSDAQSLFSPRSSNQLNSHSCKESLTLPLKDMTNGMSDSGLASGPTDQENVELLLPVSVKTGLKRRNPGSDSSEEDSTPGRPFRSRFLRSRQLSKSCRAIYDEVGIGEVMRDMADLCQKVAAQKLLIMQSLENDCSKEEISIQIAELQDLHRQYVRLEAVIELRKENALFRMQQNRGAQFGGLFPTNENYEVAGRASALTRSMPSLRTASEDSTCWIHIPSFVLRGVGRQARYEYELRIYTEDESWVLMRRYNRFRELHLSMCAKYGRLVEALDFPPKQWLLFNKESLARKRKSLLETYLRNLIAVCSSVRGCPLFECGEFPSRQDLLQFSPFFRKGLFEPGKYGTG